MRSSAKPSLDRVRRARAQGGDPTGIRRRPNRRAVRTACARPGDLPLQVGARQFGVSSGRDEELLADECWCELECGSDPGDPNLLHGAFDEEECELLLRLGSRRGFLKPLHSALDDLDDEP